jgi:hypothetical protein
MRGILKFYLCSRRVPESFRLSAIGRRGAWWHIVAISDLESLN